MAASTNKVGDFYDQVADMIDEVWDGNIHWGYWVDENDGRSFQEAADLMTDKMIERLAPVPGQRILDIGCGLGAPALRLASRHDVEVVGITISHVQVERGNERAKSAGLGDRVRFEYADAMALPFPDGSFDGGWALESMMHMPDKGQVLREVHRVLRPGGRFVIADVVQGKATQQAAAADRQVLVDEARALSERHSTFVGLAEYRGMVEQTGLESVEITDVTTNAHRSLSAMLPGLLAHREELIKVVGVETVEWMSANAERMKDFPEFSYILASAVRP